MKPAGTGAYHMLPTQEVERLIERWPPEFQDIALDLRSLIVAAAPGATETIHRKGLTYYFAERGGPVSASLCQIILQPDHLRLAFIHGAFLPDPKGLLQSGKEKYKRFVKLSAYERVPWDDLRDLIASAARFDPYTLTMKPENG